MILIIVISSILIFLNFNDEKKEEIIEVERCPVIINEVKVEGFSMAPFINPGDIVTAIYDYYNCHDVLRDDVVLYDYPGNKNLLIKFVRAIPGDTWGLKKNNNGYEIVVNGASLLNAEEKPYLISESSIKMLQLYIKDYPIIPIDTYLLLGDKISGSMDSTRFGLISRKDIMAKVKVGERLKIK